MDLIVYQSDGLWEDTVPLSGCVSIQWSVVATRGEKLEQCVMELQWWSLTFSDSACGGQVGTIDFLCSPNCPFSFVLVLFGGQSKPVNDGCAEKQTLLLQCRPGSAFLRAGYTFLAETGSTSSAGHFWQQSVCWILIFPPDTLFLSVVLGAVLRGLSLGKSRLQ